MMHHQYEIHMMNYKYEPSSIWWTGLSHTTLTFITLICIQTNKQAQQIIRLHVILKIQIFWTICTLRFLWCSSQINYWKQHLGKYNCHSMKKCFLLLQTNTIVTQWRNILYISNKYNLHSFQFWHSKKAQLQLLALAKDGKLKQQG